MSRTLTTAQLRAMQAGRAKAARRARIAACERVRATQAWLTAIGRQPDGSWGRPDWVPHVLASDADYAVARAAGMIA